MKTNLKNLFNLKHFFNIEKATDSYVKYNLRKPSQMLIKNIHLNWLEYVYYKTYKDMPIYVNKIPENLPSIPYGYVHQNLMDYDKETMLEHNFSYSFQNKPELQLDLMVPQQDAMQYFIKWQRYRKYWWSSISTTPSLFSVKDIKYEDKSANVDIIAQLSCGEHLVENINIEFDNDSKAQLSCCMSFTNALNILLLDGLNNNSKEEYLRLHRKIAPFKISFGLNVKEADKKDTLKELAILLHHKLKSNKISTWLPEFTLSYESQIKENLHLGVTYTAVLSDETLNNGIFKLLNSSTMLGEQVHVADFHKYAALLFEN